MTVKELDEEIDLNGPIMPVKKQACVKRNCLRCEKKINVPKQYFMCTICRAKNMSGNNGAIENE